MFSFGLNDADQSPHEGVFGIMLWLHENGGADYDNINANNITL